MEAHAFVAGLSQAAKAFKLGLAAQFAALADRDQGRLDMAVTYFRRAVVAAAGDDPHRGKYTNGLGVALLDRYRLTGDVGDLDEALDHLVAAFEAAARQTMGRARVLRNLFDALELRLSLADAPLTDDRRARLPSLDSLRREKSRTPGLTAIERLGAARESGHTAVAERGLAQGCPDLTYAVKLLPLAVWGGRDQVLEFLADYRGLASEAASSAVAAGDVALAVRVLEQGRAVVWQQDLTNRTPREELLRQLVAQGPRPYEGTDKTSLAKTHTKAGRNRSGRAADRQAPSLPSDLVERMDRAYAALTRLPPGADASPDKGDPRLDFDRWGFPWRTGVLPGPAELSDAVREWASLSRTARRGLPYISFQLPDYQRDIRPAASDGPVVYLNVSPWRCDAMIVTRSGEKPTLVPLPDLTAADAEQQAQRYLAAMMSDGAGREDVVRDVLYWLWHTVASPVLAVVAQLPEFAGATAQPHVWWIPTGPLTTLPLHAALSADGRSVLDRVTSSYTPTVSALTRARTVRRASDLGRRPTRRHLLVAPAAGDLPATKRTLVGLAKLLPRGQRTRLVGSDATWDKVHEELPRHAWAHFDCHAVQNFDEPLTSRLSLHDRDLTVADLIELPGSSTEFALLAACTTAAGGSFVRDEWVSLAAALMYAEYQAVIGTLWPVPDGPTARIARDVYAALIPPVEEPLTSEHTRATSSKWRRFLRCLLPFPRHRSAAPNPRPSRTVDLNAFDSAHALHRALLCERARRPDHPSAWVSFVHYGV
ncbi:CHAT domain-containing protein [Streptomyces sp. Ru87]|uniref:CHAT domain-containing protein n=1 Tax=Streptomyces sp. Ru87 TaxID=2044307 RepID=UPI0015D4C078|nr:CHAT domain-containing protein [Streptomyces sp. Ru87]